MKIELLKETYSVVEGERNFVVKVSINRGVISKVEVSENDGAFRTAPDGIASVGGAIRWYVKRGGK